MLLRIVHQTLNKITISAFCAIWLLALLLPQSSHAAATIETSTARLRSIDKITARTLTFEIDTGSTVKFGPLYIKLQACRKSPDIEEPESAAFMQIWEVTDEGTLQEKSEWVFSGWMFASSPGLSAMDHPIYDVWVLDCFDKQETASQTEPSNAMTGDVMESEGLVDEDQVPSQPEAESQE